LLRALGHIDYVRTKIDKEDEQDPALLLKQADLLERLRRPQAAAPLLEELLEMASDGRWETDAANYAKLEKRLSKLDQRNASLKTARSRAKYLAKTARGLLADYEASKKPMPLRSYTFASLVAAALDDKDDLGKSAARLRKVARDAGVLHGSTYKLVGGEGSWKTIFTNGESAFEHHEDHIELEGVRPVGRLCTAVSVSGEYEIRAKLTRVGESKIGSHHGIVFSGTDGGDWLAITIDHSGKLMLKRMMIAGGGTSDIGLSYVTLKQAPPLDQSIDIVVHVTPIDEVEVTVNGDGPYPFRTPLALPAVGHVGVYVKYGRVVVEDAVVEVLP
jgi:hypothetical protein